MEEGIHDVCNKILSGTFENTKDKEMPEMRMPRGKLNYLIMNSRR